MAKRQDLYLQRRSRPEQSDQCQPNQAANISHQPRASPDSTSLASRIEFPTMTTFVPIRRDRRTTSAMRRRSRAVQRPTMKFVATKTADQLDLQALHRVRERLVSQRTGIINQIRAFLLERSIAVRQGQRFLRAELPRILATPPDVLSPRMARVIEDLASDWRRLDERIEGLSTEIGVLARADSGCARLMSVPGI